MPNRPKKKNAASQTLYIEGECTIFRAAELLPVLVPGDGAKAPEQIDLSRVTEIDSAGVQLLMHAKKRALAEGRELHLVAHSAAVTEVFELLNLAAFFGDPLVVPPRAAATA